MSCYLFNQAKITTNSVEEKCGAEMLILSVSCSENHQNIMRTVTLNIHHIAWQGRKNHYKVRNLKWDNLVPDVLLRAGVLVHHQVQ